jgi:UDP-3-O-[3-hydroxymyristoyl] glucosamine N-acyltransferase
MARTLGELAALIGGELRGDGEVRIERVSPPDRGSDGSIVVLFGEAAPEGVRSASAVVVKSGTEVSGMDAIEVAAPRLALARLLETLHAPPRPAPGVHPTAVVHEDAVLGAEVHVGPYAVLGRCTVGDRAVISTHCILGDGVRIGTDAMLYPRVTVLDRCEVGDRSVLHAGVVVGGDGFGYEPGPAGLVKVPQVGNVVIGDDVEVGALTAFDRAALPEESTRIGQGTKIDNLCQIAHGVEVGRHAVICGCCAIGGSTTIGDGAVLGGAVAIGDHTRIGAGAQLGGATALGRDVEPGAAIYGYPGRPLQEQLRIQAALSRLPDLLQRMRSVEKRLDRVAPSKPDRPSEA